MSDLPNILLHFLETYPFVLAFILGLFPAMIWMWFWIKEDVHPEPPKMLTLSFLGGIIAVICIIPFEKFVYTHFQNYTTISFILWASLEEIFKFAFVYCIALRNKVTDEPADDIIYLIVSALGFVTFENTLFLITPIHNGDIIGTIVSGNLRFVGASLLHIMSSATIGICLGLSFYKSNTQKIIYGILGVILAIILHTTFNLFIMNGAQADIFFIFGAVWVGIVALLLLFEKVKHIKPDALIKNPS